MSHHIKSILTIAGLTTLLSTSVMALPSDRSQAINVEADKASISKKTGTSTYSGNVVVKQGSMRISAEKLVVHTKHGKLQMMRAQGGPVEFKQQAKDNKNIYASAQTMTYQANTNIIIFEKNAELRQGANKFASNRIIYDINKDTVNAGKKSGGDRVTITIQPAEPAKP